jgi:hypothetical protein
MDDKDRLGKAHGAARRPEAPDPDPDPNADPAGAIPREPEPGDPDGADATRGEDARAAGTADDPIAGGDGFGSDDYQAGDLSEQAAQRSGPVDISRERPRRR